MEYDLKKLVKKARIEIIENPNILLIKTRFEFFNKFDLGLLIYGIIGSTSIYISLNSGSSSTLMLIIIAGLFFIVGLILLAYSFFTILFQITNFVSITENEIKIRNDLKTSKFKLDPSMKVKMKARNFFVKMGHGYGMGSDFRIVEIFLNHKEEELRIFKFIVDEKDTKEANILGSEIIRKIKGKINLRKN